MMLQNVLLKLIDLPDDGLSEYRVQYTQAGHREGRPSESGDFGVWLPPSGEEGTLPHERGDEEDDDTDEEAEAHLGKSFSWCRTGVNAENADVMLISSVFFTPKPGLRISSIEKFVILCMLDSTFMFPLLLLLSSSSLLTSISSSRRFESGECSGDSILILSFINKNTILKVLVWLKKIIPSLWL